MCILWFVVDIRLDCQHDAREWKTSMSYRIIPVHNSGVYDDIKYDDDNSDDDDDDYDGKECGRLRTPP